MTRDFDKRPGLKFLLQKVAHASTAANLYKLTCVSLTVYMHALLEICAHQDGLCIDNIKDMLATASPPACPRARIDTHMHTFVHMLKVRLLMTPFHQTRFWTCDSSCIHLHLLLHVCFNFFSSFFAFPFSFSPEGLCEHLSRLSSTYHPTPTSGHSSRVTNVS